MVREVPGGLGNRRFIGHPRARNAVVGCAVLAGVASAATMPLVLFSVRPAAFSGASDSGVETGKVTAAHADASSFQPGGVPSKRTLLVSSRVSSTATNSNLPADCVPSPAGPPTSPYQLGLVGTAANGMLTAGPASVANVTAKFCGIVTLVNGKPPCGATGSVTSPIDGQIYGPLTVALTLVPGMTPTIGFTVIPGTITGGFTCTSSSQNGLAVFLNAEVSGSTAPLFGVSCTIGPFNLPLTGTVTGPLNALTATLSSSDFTVPALTPSPSCPASVAANIDDIVGLPLAPGGGSATLPITASIYQPVAP